MLQLFSLLCLVHMCGSEWLGLSPLWDSVDPPGGRAYHSLLPVSAGADVSLFFLFGGSIRGTRLNDAYFIVIWPAAYDIPPSSIPVPTWLEPPPRESAVAWSVPDGHLFIGSGLGGSDGVLFDLWQYNMDTFEFAQLLSNDLTLPVAAGRASTFVEGRVRRPFTGYGIPVSYQGNPNLERGIGRDEFLRTDSLYVFADVRGCVPSFDVARRGSAMPGPYGGDEAPVMAEFKRAAAAGTVHYSWADGFDAGWTRIPPPSTRVAFSAPSMSWITDTDGTEALVIAGGTYSGFPQTPDADFVVFRPRGTNATAWATPPAWARAQFPELEVLPADGSNEPWWVRLYTAGGASRTPKCMPVSEILRLGTWDVHPYKSVPKTTRTPAARNSLTAPATANASSPDQLPAPTRVPSDAQRPAVDAFPVARFAHTGVCPVPGGLLYTFGYSLRSEMQESYILRNPLAANVSWDVVSRPQGDVWPATRFRSPLACLVLTDRIVLSAFGGATSEDGEAVSGSGWIGHIPVQNDLVNGSSTRREYDAVDTVWRAPVDGPLTVQWSQWASTLPRPSSRTHHCGVSIGVVFIILFGERFDAVTDELQLLSDVWAIRPRVSAHGHLDRRDMEASTAARDAAVQEDNVRTDRVQSRVSRFDAFRRAMRRLRNGHHSGISPTRPRSSHAVEQRRGDPSPRGEECGGGDWSRDRFGRRQEADATAPVDLWVRITTQLTPPSRHSACAATLGSIVYVFGGLGANGALQDIWSLSFTPSFSPLDGAPHGGIFSQAGDWMFTLLPAVNVLPARYGHACAMIPGSDRFIVYGGTDGSAVFSDLWEFDVSSDRWTQVHVVADDGSPPALVPRIPNTLSRSGACTAYDCVDRASMKHATPSDVPEGRYYTQFSPSNHPARRLPAFVMFGGAGPFETFTDLWWLQALGSDGNVSVYVWNRLSVFSPEGPAASSEGSLVSSGRCEWWVLDARVFEFTSTATRRIAIPCGTPETYRLHLASRADLNDSSFNSTPRLHSYLSAFNASMTGFRASDPDNAWGVNVDGTASVAASAAVALGSSFVTFGGQPSITALATVKATTSLTFIRRPKRICSPDSARDNFTYGDVVHPALFFGRLPLPDGDNATAVREFESLAASYSLPAVGKFPSDMCSWCSSGFEIAARPAGDNGLDEPECVACAAGFYSSPSDASCVACPRGTRGIYRAASSKHSCLPCDGNYFGPVEGASVCEVCPPRHICPLGSPVAIDDEHGNALIELFGDTDRQIPVQEPTVPPILYLGVAAAVVVSLAITLSVAFFARDRLRWALPKFDLFYQAHFHPPGDFLRTRRTYLGGVMSLCFVIGVLSFLTVMGLQFQYQNGMISQNLRPLQTAAASSVNRQTYFQVRFSFVQLQGPRCLAAGSQLTNSVEHLVPDGASQPATATEPLSVRIGRCSSAFSVSTTGVTFFEDSNATYNNAHEQEAYMADVFEATEHWRRTSPVVNASRPDYYCLETLVPARGANGSDASYAMCEVVYSCPGCMLSETANITASIHSSTQVAAPFVASRFWASNPLFGTQFVNSSAFVGSQTGSVAYAGQAASVFEYSVLLTDYQNRVVRSPWTLGGWVVKHRSTEPGAVVSASSFFREKQLHATVRITQEMLLLSFRILPKQSVIEFLANIIGVVPGILGAFAIALVIYEKYKTVVDELIGVPDTDGPAGLERVEQMRLQELICDSLRGAENEEDLLDYDNCRPEDRKCSNCNAMLPRRSIFCEDCGCLSLKHIIRPQQATKAVSLEGVRIAGPAGAPPSALAALSRSNKVHPESSPADPVAAVTAPPPTTPRPSARLPAQSGAAALGGAADPTVSADGYSEYLNQVVGDLRSPPAR